MTKLRIGVNALYMLPGGVGGTEIYLRNLLAALAEIDPVNDYFLFTNQETGTELIGPRPNFRTCVQPVRASFRPARIFWEQTGLPLELRRYGIDVVLNPGFTAPLVSPCPSVTVFHDLQHKRLPEHFRWFDLPFWQFLLWGSAHRAARLIADSGQTRHDLLRFYRLPESRIRVIPLGVEERFFEIARKREHTAPERFLLCVSTLHPHKNLERLIRVFARFHGERPGFTLVLSGLRGFHTRAVEELTASLNLSGVVRLTGWIPREDLYGLFERAFAFVYPSTFEGFGIPVAEALAAGIPTACSSIEPLVSLAGDAALPFDPHDEEALYQALVRLTSDAELRERLGREGPRRARRFSWRKTAELTLETIVEAAAR